VRDQPDDIVALHNTRKGELFIVGCGPSLLSQVDLLPQLEGRDTWGINRLPTWADMPFDLTYWSAHEGNLMTRHGGNVFDFLPLEGTECFTVHPVPTRFSRRGVAQWVAKSEDVVVENHVAGLGETLPPLSIAYSGVGIACQLAFWMGYTDIFILGSEFSDAGYVWDPGAGRSFDRGQAHRAIRGMTRVAQAAEAHGRRVIDCTPGGLLNAYGGVPGPLPFTELAEVL
jgi:hypothetical protein